MESIYKYRLKKNDYFVDCDKTAFFCRERYAACFLWPAVIDYQK